METKTLSRFKQWLLVLLVAIFALIGNKLLSQEVPITFRIENVECTMPIDPILTPWVFDTDDPGWWTHDRNPLTYSNAWGYAWHNYAYKWFYSTDDPVDETMDPTSSWCTAENLDYVDGLGGFRIEFEQYNLTGWEHLNTVNPGAAWNIIGQAGDKRTYTSGVGLIYHDDGGGEELVLRVEDCVLTVYVSYPSVVQMQEYIPTWASPIGSGAATMVEGWGVVDVFNSDPDWVDTFANPAVGNRIEFLMSSMDHVLQNLYGYYSFDLGLIAAEHEIQQGNAFVPINPIEPVLIPFPSLDVDFEFNAAVGGGAEANLNNLSVFVNIIEPEGVFPDPIQSILPQSWGFTTDLASFNTSITFNLMGMGFGDSNNWQVLRKIDLQDNWQVWPDVTVIDANRIMANNVTGFSEWTVGNTDDITLPVVLSSFTAQGIADGIVQIAWTTQTESNLIGYRLYRNLVPELDSAILINPNIIPATNTSSVQNYTYNDAEINYSGNYYYWLEQMEFDGFCHIYGPCLAIFEQSQEEETPPLIGLSSYIRSIFPNPGTNMTIQYQLAKNEDVTLCIHNLKGQKVRTLHTGFKTTGTYHQAWNGKDDNGIPCASGIYFAEFRAGNNQPLRKKLLLLK